MVNPKTILAEWVTALQSLPHLVDALGGNADNIQYYSENRIVFGQRTQNNVRLGILSMPPGSIMVAWEGTDPTPFDRTWHFGHHFKLYLRAPEIDDVGYEDISDWIVNDVPNGSGTLRMLHASIDPACGPMSDKGPAFHRETVVIGADGTTFEYFVAPIFLREDFNP